MTFRGRMYIVRQPDGRLVSRCFFSIPRPDGTHDRAISAVDLAHVRAPSFWQRRIGWRPFWTWAPTDDRQGYVFGITARPMSAHQRTAFLADLRRRGRAT